MLITWSQSEQAIKDKPSNEQVCDVDQLFVFIEINTNLCYHTSIPFRWPFNLAQDVVKIALLLLYVCLNMLVLVLVLSLPNGR